MVFKLITPATESPVSLQEAKDHLRVEWDEENNLILSTIQAATQAAEQYLWSAIMEQEFEAKVDNFCHILRIEKGGVSEITEINYLDSNGDNQILSPSKYSVDIVSEPARILFNDIPTVKTQTLHPVTIKFKAGKSDVSEVNQAIKHAILMIIGHLFEHREDVGMVQMYQVPMGAKWLLNPYRVFSFK